MKFYLNISNENYKDLKTQRNKFNKCMFDSFSY